MQVILRELSFVTLGVVVWVWIQKIPNIQPWTRVYIWDPKPKGTNLGGTKLVNPLRKTILLRSTTKTLLIWDCRGSA